MITSSKLRLWLLLTHALIPIAFGHGVLVLAILEVWTFPYVTNDPFSFSFNASFESHLPVIGLTTFLGQLCFVCSFFYEPYAMDKLLPITGLILLWTSVIYCTIGTEHYFSLLACIPFFICSMLFFAGYRIKQFFRWVLANV